MNGNGYSHHNTNGGGSSSSISIGHAAGLRTVSASSGRDLHLLSPGTEVVVTRTVSPSFFSPSNPVEAVFRKDDVVRISAPTSDPCWFRARNMKAEDGLVHVDFIRSSNSCSSVDAMRGAGGGGSTIGSAGGGSGFIPLNNSSHTHMPWFHSNITRETTERYLHHKADGTFLVRESTNFPGDYTLSMAYKGKVEHYRIYQAEGQLTCDNEEFFSNLTQLVSHYKRDADGLCSRLVTPVICENYRIPAASSADIEDRTSVFRQAGLVIPTSEIRLGDIIGHGEFGDVLLGVYKDKKVAVKVSKRHGSGMLDSLLDESKFMVGLSHPNLVLLVGVVLDDVNVYMVTEYMANGNLVDLLRSRGRHQLEKNQLIQFAIDICQGMCYLESKQIVHRDLAARNVLLDEDMMAKVADLGLAKKAHTASHDSSSGKFPIKWTAPEALRHSNFSSKSDMWSFGVLLWEIFSFGRVPYPRIPIQDVVRHIERGYRMEAPEGCPAEVVRVMTDAWALQPNERPTFGQVLQRLTVIARTIGQS